VMRGQDTRMQSVIPSRPVSCNLALDAAGSSEACFVQLGYNHPDPGSWFGLWPTNVVFGRWKWSRLSPWLVILKTVRVGERSYEGVSPNPSVGAFFSDRQPAFGPSIALRCAQSTKSQRVWFF